MTEKKMTEIEAAEMLKAYYVCQQMQVKGIYEKCNSNKCDDCDLCYEQGNSGEHIQSVEKAVQALEEVQQYRAIGTPEELQDMKSNYFEALSDWRQYRKIGTLEECRTAREKQIPKKPVKSENQVVRYVNTYYCPICNLGITGTNIAKWCYHCGQKLDWSDENETD